jgi:hypothetical protein
VLRAAIVCRIDPPFLKNRPAGHAVAVSFAFRALVGLKQQTSAIVRTKKG